MYLFFGIFFIVLLLFFCLNHWRRKKIMKKVCSLCMDEKCDILNTLIEPLGYCYIPTQDVFSTHINAWQREFGYCAFYDKAASHFNMIFDCLPVYFNYHEKTWLIEFWKGQYGINTGCEIGVYYADRIISKEERATTLFHCVNDEDMLTLSLQLFQGNHCLAHLCAKHWWLTSFTMGCFSQPAGLSLRACVTLDSPEMASAFVQGLQESGYSPEKICVCCNTVCFTFANAKPVRNILHRIRIRICQWINHFWCQIYLWVTRPFRLSVDKILYLYYYLPFAFRKMVNIRRYKKYKPRG